MNTEPNQHWIAEKQRARAEWIRRTEPLLPEPQSREWWLAEAKRTKTDWSALLRQRLRVLAWVRAGRPKWAEWRNAQSKLPSNPQGNI